LPTTITKSNYTSNLQQIIDNLYPNRRHWSLIDRNFITHDTPDQNEYYQIRDSENNQVLATITLYGTKMVFTRYANGPASAPSHGSEYIQLSDPNSLQQIKELIDSIQHQLAQEEWFRTST
jgi:hypothetical protein